MKINLRQKIANVVAHYQSCQTSGIKDIDKQLEIFTEDCVLMSFSSAALVGKSGMTIFKGKEEIRKCFDSYNKQMRTPSNVKIENFDLVIDEENLRCNFNMLIHVKVDPKHPVVFFNTLQFHLNEELKIFKAYNWQGNAGTENLYALVEKRF